MSNRYKIAVIPGDGTGPEVTVEAIKVLRKAGTAFDFNLDFHEFDFGGDRFLKTGETLPDSAVDELARFDAILLGAIGHPDVKPGILEKGILLKLRFELDQYINLRPVKLFPGVDTPLKGKGPKEIDYVVVRENIGDLYTGALGILLKLRFELDQYINLRPVKLFPGGLYNEGHATGSCHSDIDVYALSGGSLP